MYIIRVPNDLYLCIPVNTTDLSFYPTNFAVNAVNGDLIDDKYVRIWGINCNIFLPLSAIFLNSDFCFSITNNILNNNFIYI